MSLNLPNSLSPLTFGVWFKKTNEGANAWVASFGSYPLGIGELGGDGPLYIVTFGMGDNDLPALTTSVNTGDWCYVVLTYDGTTAKSYVNGSPDVSAAKSWPYTAYGVGEIGQCANRNSWEQYNGSVGQVVVYNRVLSDAEVLQNFNATKSRYGL